MYGNIPSIYNKFENEIYTNWVNTL
jgi:hypothetical protein